MTEAVHFFTVQISLLAIVLVLHTYMGLHVIRRTLIFSDLVLDQLAAFGAMVGIGMAIRYGSPGSYGMSLAAVLVRGLATLSEILREMLLLLASPAADLL